MNRNAIIDDDMNVDPNMRSTVYMSCMHTSANYMLSNLPLNSCRCKLKVKLDDAYCICCQHRIQHPQEGITKQNPIARALLHSDSVSHQSPSGSPSSIATMQQLVQSSQVIISQLDQQRKQLSWTQRRALKSLKRSLDQFTMQIEYIADNVSTIKHRPTSNFITVNWHHQQNTARVQLRKIIKPEGWSADIIPDDYTISISLHHQTLIILPT